MTLAQMNSLGGAAQLETTVDQLFRNCGLPAAMIDHGPADGAKQRIQWRGATMSLSAMDWSAVYGMPQRGAGWVNEAKPEKRCTSGLSRMLFHTKGNVGVLSMKKKPQGIGYVTDYVVPKDQFKAHKVVALNATMASSLPVSTLVERYGKPDEVLKQPGNKDRFRYWVLVLRGQRPETLHAVDFTVENGMSKDFMISTSGTDFVQQRLEVMLREWERDYVLD